VCVLRIIIKKKLAAVLRTSALTLYCYPVVTLAQTSNEPAEIIVTANRTAKTVDETLAPVSIITQQDIQRSQATSLSELLRSTPGISFTSNGGFGSTSGMSLRGSNTDHTLYLIDGLPIRSATSGAAAIEYLPLSQIDRIEVVRGPRSSLYGSDAIGGVIQIFTRKNQDKAFTASAGYGSDSSKQIQSSYADANNSSSFSGGLSFFETDGYDFYGRDNYGTINAGDQDDDGYDNYALSLNGAHKITQDIELSGTFLRSQGKSQFDGYGNDKTRTDYTEQSASGSVDFTISESWGSKLTSGRSYDKQYTRAHDLALPNIYFTNMKDHFNTRTDFTSWQNDIIIRDTDLLSVGLDYKEDKVDSSVSFAEDSRWNQAVFGQYLYYGEVFNSQLSYRYDDNESFGSHNTWSFATGFDLDDNVRITASYGTAFKAPTFNDLYFPDVGYFKGNPDLKPEESKSFDFGVELSIGDSKWTAHYFDTQVDNLISYVYAPFPAVSMMQNVAEANIDGVEFTMSTELYGWTLAANASFINPINSSTGLLLARKRHK